MKTEMEKFVKKADMIIDLRGYLEEEKQEGKGIVDIIASDPETKQKITIRVITRSTLKSGAIGTEEVRKMKKLLKESGVGKGILIGGAFTSAAKREMAAEGVETISEKSLPPFNIFTHYMVPKHEILTSKEAKEVLDKYRVKPYQLPLIKLSDPAAVAIGAKIGDILKITRKSSTAGIAIFYRYVVS